MKATRKKQAKAAQPAAGQGRKALRDMQPGAKQQAGVKAGTKSFHPIASCW